MLLSGCVLAIAQNDDEERQKRVDFYGYIVTADSFDPFAQKQVRSYVNGELRQDGLTSQMIFNCAQVISYASKYVRLEPGDLIFTGTPSGVALEKKDSDAKKWLKAGDVVDIEIEDIGTLRNTMK